MIIILIIMKGGGQQHVKSATLFSFCHKKVKRNLHSFHVLFSKGV